MSFKSKFNLQRRKEEFSKIKAKHTDHIPIIIEKFPSSKLPELGKPTMIINNKLRVLQLTSILIKKLEVASKESIFLMADSPTGRVNLSQDQMLKEVYERHKEDDGFLYLLYNGNQTFGSP